MSEMEVKYLQQAPLHGRGLPTGAGTCGEQDGGCHSAWQREQRCCRKRWRVILQVLGVVREKGKRKKGAQVSSTGEQERGRTYICPLEREPGNYADNRSIPVVELTAISISTKYLILKYSQAFFLVPDSERHVTLSTGHQR